MRTHLTIKLQKIANLANSYSKAIWSAYMAEQSPSKATKLCTLWGALHDRVSHVQEMVYVMEFGQKRRNAVTRKEEKVYTLPDPAVKKAYQGVAHIVDKIMFLAKKHVESNTLPDFNTWALA